jgi:hypothetical protein
MTDAHEERLDGGCCGGHAHGVAAEGHSHAGGAGHLPAAGLCGHDEACAGTAEACAGGADACCGGHDHVDDLFAFPTTTESVTVPAVTLAGILDLVEKLAPDLASLTDEVDYQEGQRLLAEQAPELVGLREAFLERMKALLNDVAAGGSASY